MKARIKQLWRWIRGHGTALPEPATTEPKQAEPKRWFFGLTWRF